MLVQPLVFQCGLQDQEHKRHGSDGQQAAMSSHANQTKNDAIRARHRVFVHVLLVPALDFPDHKHHLPEEFRQRVATHHDEHVYHSGLSWRRH